MEEDVEVIFESWVLRLTGLDGRSILRLSSQWKKRYMILIRQHESASILYYSHKPQSLNAAPKGMIVLEPYYRVEKRHNVRGQRYVVSLKTPSKRFVVAVDDERIFHLLSFYLQVQIKLNDDVEEECFVVRPDNSDDQRKIGARGNMCLLHISPWGVTLSLQLSKCVIVQWPLTCIRNYESTGRGQFILTVGKRAHMGIGRYVFNTRLSQDNVIYDRLDRYVIDAAGMRNSQADNISQTSLVEQDNLQQLTYVQANPQFSNHLRKISRDIYDSLWQHLGSTRLKASSPDLVSDSPHVRQRDFPRSSSTATLDGSSSSAMGIPSNPTTPRQSLRRKMSSPANLSLGTSTISSPDDFSSLPRNFRRTAPPRVSTTSPSKRRPVDQIESEYLHTPDPESTYFDMESSSNMLMMEGGAAGGNGITARPPLGSTSTSIGTSKSASVSSEPSHSPPPMAAAALTSRQKPRLLRLHSRSAEDLITYTEMSSPPKSPPPKSGGSHSNNNSEHFHMRSYSNPAGSTDMRLVGDSMSNNVDLTDSTLDGYEPFDEVEQTRAAAQKLAQRRLYDGTASSAASSSSSSSTNSRDPLPTGYIRKSLVRHTSMKKAMSNPSLLDADSDTVTTDPVKISSPPSTTRAPNNAAQKPPLPFNSKYQKGADRTQSTMSSGKSMFVTSSAASNMTSPTPVLSYMTSPAPVASFVSSQTMSLGSSMPAGASPMTSRALFMNSPPPKGIHMTSKTKVFRRPTPEQATGPVLKQTTSPTSAGYIMSKKEDHRRQESTSSGYASGGAGESDLRETHC